jgi:hypothetical protein
LPFSSITAYMTNMSRTDVIHIIKVPPFSTTPNYLLGENILKKTKMRVN